MRRSLPASQERPFGFQILGRVDEPPERLRRRVQALVTCAIVLSNIVGAGVVLALNVWIIPGPGLLTSPRRDVALVLAPAYIVAALATGAWWGTREQLRQLRWVTEGRPPTADEQRAALGAPSRLLVLQILLWAAAVLVFTGIALTTGSARIDLRTGLTVALGGTVTCGFAYLLSEVALRPVAARALAVSATVETALPGLGVRTLLVWLVGTGAPAAGLMIVAGVVLGEPRVSATALAGTILGLGSITVAAGLALLAVSTRALTDPLRALGAALRRVESGDFGTRIVVYDATEIGRAQTAFNSMAAGLEERERLRDLFSRHVGDEVARAALERGADLGGVECDASALFVDIVGSTALAQHTSAAAVVAVLNRFFEQVVTVVDAHGGWVNKFEGDAALCVFGPPNGLTDHAGAALRAVRDLRRSLDDFAATNGITAGVGVASGTVVAGNVGARNRFEYTVIGDPVNTAARLTELAKGRGTGVLAAESAIERAPDDERARWRRVDRVVLRGRTAPTVLFTVES